MSERDRLFLGHILGAIDDICSFTAEGRPGFMAMVEQDLPPLRQQVEQLLATPERFA